jgi:hypothetical protein
MALNKGELIKILVEDYGYEKEDLKFDVNGNPYTNAKLQAIINAEIADAEEMETNSNRIITKDTTGLKDEDKVRVMSGSSGTVIYRSDTSRRMWKFTKFGQMDNMPYGELVTIRNSFPRYFREGWIVVLDTKVQDEFKLTEMYKNILTPDNIDEVFTKDIEELTVLVKNLPDGMKNTFINKAQELYDTKKLDSMRVVELIEESFGFSLRDNAPTEDYALKSDLGQQNIIYVDKR